MTTKSILINTAATPTVGFKTNNASIVEGNSGITKLNFVVELSSPSASSVTVDYNTDKHYNISATRYEDYTPVTSQVTFAPGETSKTITVDIIGDTKYEGSEYFYLELTSATGADIVIDGAEGFRNSWVAATIKNDDTAATLDVTFTPTDEAIGVAVNNNIVLNFNEAIARGTGNIILTTSSGATVATYDAATSSNLSISGTTLTINPSADLAYSTEYKVELAAGSIKGLAGNNYAGTTSYNFTTQSGTVTPPVTSNLDDFIVLQQSSPAFVGADVGNDTYLLSGSMIGAGQNLTISDAKGSNSIQLADGLSIASSKVASNAMLLTLTNGGIVTINGADTFTYEAGGNSTAGINNVDVSFASFAQNTLGVTVPVSGVATGGAVAIGQGEAGSVTQLIAGSSLPVTATSQADVFGFTPSAAKALVANTQISISQFDVAQDKLQFDLTTALGITTLAALNGVEGISISANVITNETSINFGSDANGDLVVLVLVGITEPSAVTVNVI